MQNALFRQPMKRYVLKRLLTLIPVLLGVTFLTYGLMYRSPSDPVALAMSLSPDVLLADEPTSALDVTVQAQIVSELIRLRDHFDTALLLVTHNMGVVAKAADTVAVMYCGKVVEYGAREEVLQTPAHPYTRTLIDAIPKLDGTPPKGVPGSRPKHFSGEGCDFAGRCPNCACDCEAEMLTPVHLSRDHWALCGSVSLPNL